MMPHAHVCGRLAAGNNCICAGVCMCSADNNYMCIDSAECWCAHVFISAQRSTVDVAEGRLTFRQLHAVTLAESLAP